MNQIDDTILAHWKILVLIWVGINFVMGMPTPKSDSPTWYKWLFTSLHGIAGAIPRIVMSFFPTSFLGRILGGNGNAAPKPNGSTPAPSSPSTAR